MTVTMQTNLNAYAAAGAAASNLDAPVPFLTPEALMTYCATRLQGIDSQVNDAFQKQTDANNAVDSMNKITNWITSNVGAGGWDMSLPPAQGGAYGQLTLGTIQDEIKKLPPGSQAANMLISLRDEIADRMDSSGKPSNLRTALDTGKYDPSASVAPNKSDADLVSAFGGTPDKVSKVDPTTTIANWTTELGNDVKQMNSGSELMMINLQQLVSERQTTVQLTTGMLQSIEDGAKAVVSNIHG